MSVSHGHGGEITRQTSSRHFTSEKRYPIKTHLNQHSRLSFHAHVLPYVRRNLHFIIERKEKTTLRNTDSDCTNYSKD